MATREPAQRNLRGQANRESKLDDRAADEAEPRPDAGTGGSAAS